MSSRALLLFGYAAHAESSGARKKMGELAALLENLCGEPIHLSGAASYDALEKGMRDGHYDVAWLPPIPFMALERDDKVTALVSNHRGGTSQFHAVLFVRASSRIHTPVGLRGKRVAWVDRLSAAGFVLPRIGLAALGVDPRTAFGEERFYGSHEAVVRAVVGGKADVGATYARLDRAGGAVHGAWADLPGAEEAIRVLVSFGKIPGDVIAARRGLSAPRCERMTRALLAICREVTGQMLVRDVFGVHEFRKWKAEGYDDLRTMTTRAADEGLLDTAKIGKV